MSLWVNRVWQPRFDLLAKAMRRRLRRKREDWDAPPKDPLFAPTPESKPKRVPKGNAPVRNRSGKLSRPGMFVAYLDDPAFTTQMERALNAMDSMRAPQEPSARGIPGLEPSGYVARTGESAARTAQRALGALDTARFKRQADTPNGDVVFDFYIAAPSRLKPLRRQLRDLRGKVSQVGDRYRVIFPRETMQDFWQKFQDAREEALHNKYNFVTFNRLEEQEIEAAVWAITHRQFSLQDLRQFIERNERRVDKTKEWLMRIRDSSFANQVGVRAQMAKRRLEMNALVHKIEMQREVLFRAQTILDEVRSSR